MPSAAADAPSTGSLERDLDLEADLDLDRSAIVCECVWVVVGQSFKKKGRINKIGGETELDVWLRVLRCTALS